MTEQQEEKKLVWQVLSYFCSLTCKPFTWKHEEAKGAVILPVE